MKRDPYAQPDWREPSIASVMHGGTLLAAFLTTFDPPEAEVLIEELLPTWLGLSTALVDEGPDRLKYFAELEDALKRIRGNFTIVSSLATQVPSGHGWIWSYIRRLQVGFKHTAVQHAKLWMFHRAGQPGEPQTLELIVSSQNLSSSGVRGQVQAGWRCIMPLHSASSTRCLHSWGVLPDFLEELGLACGSGGARAIPYWKALLERATCPSDTMFLASVPGRHPSRPPQGASAWGVAGLRRLGFSSTRSMAAMVPTVGNWDAENLRRWLAVANLDATAFSLTWVEPNHPWAKRWQLNPETERALSADKINWLCLPSPQAKGKWRSPLSDEHRASDSRWSHAKVYELQSGGSRQLLITSANFSRAAWGDVLPDGHLQIDNFELGVAIRADARLTHPSRVRVFVHATGKTDFEKNVDRPIAWMAATWDGTFLFIQVRLSEGVSLQGSIWVKTPRRDELEPVQPRRMHPPEIRMGWSVGEGVPLRVRLCTTAGFICDAAVEDLRPAGLLNEWLCDAGSAEELQDLADRFIEEKYHFFDDDERSTSKRGGSNEKPGPSGASYSVAAYDDSRKRFAAIDYWVGTLGQADGCLRNGVLDDGARLASRWATIAKTDRRADIALSAGLAAEELRTRVREARNQR